MMHEATGLPGWLVSQAYVQSARHLVGVRAATATAAVATAGAERAGAATEALRWMVLVAAAVDCTCSCHRWTR